MGAATDLPRKLVGALLTKPLTEERVTTTGNRIICCDLMLVWVCSYSKTTAVVMQQQDRELNLLMMLELSGSHDYPILILFADLDFNNGRFRCLRHVVDNVYTM